MAESIDTRRDNWLRVVWGLLYVREGLQPYVDAKGKQQYQTYMNNVNAKCNNEKCGECQVNSKCFNGKNKVRGKSRFRPGHFCAEMNKQIENYHFKHEPSWINTDSTKWQDPCFGYWEVAKCFISTAGYLDKTRSNDVDASGLLSICMNNSFIRQQITNIQHFEEDIRNTTLHNARYELDGQVTDDCLDMMISVLEDPQELIHDSSSMQAANHLRKIKDRTEKTPVIMNEALHKWLQTNFDVKQSLKEIEGSMYERLCKELKVYVDEAVERKLELKREVRQKKRNYSDDDEREQQVEDLRQRLAKCYLKRINSVSISPLLSDKDERLETFYVPPKIVEKGTRKLGADDKDKGPLTSYRQLFCKEGEFLKNLFMVGEAGMGKSSCAAMCALKWANQFSSRNTINKTDKNVTPQTSFESLEKELQFKSDDIKHIFVPETKLEDHFQDDTFYKEIDFLFHLTLRDSCDVCDLTYMIRDQLINRIYQQDERDVALPTLQRVLSKNKCVIIEDGLDEWTHPNGTKCSCSEEDKVIPYLSPTIDATVLITSRPWRMSQQRIKDTKIDMLLEIQGTADTGLLLQKTLNSLNEKEAKNKILLSFVNFVEKKKLVRPLSIPIIAMLLVCLWFEDMDETFSLCDIYAYAIEMMLGRKPLPGPMVSQNIFFFPRCFQHTENVLKYYSIVMEMAQLAFTKLFSNDRTSALVFQKVDFLSQRNLLFVLRSGILQETKTASLIRKQSYFSFIHKTVQEFLAAIYMSYHLEECLEVFNTLKTDDFSQVFIFMCGLNIKFANAISCVVSDTFPQPDICEATFTICIENQIFTDMIVMGYKEAKASQESNIQLTLYNFAYTKDTNENDINYEVFNDLLAMNKSNVRSIRTVSGTRQATLQEVFSSSRDCLTKVHIHKVSGQYDLTMCNCLQDLSISGTGITNIMVNTKNLLVLELEDVLEKIESIIWELLQRESIQLKRLRITCIKNIPSFRSFCQALQLPHFGQLLVWDTDLGDQTLLFLVSFTEVNLCRVTMTARSLMMLVFQLKVSAHSAKFTLAECTVNSNTEYDIIKRFIQTSKEFKIKNTWYNSNFSFKTQVKCNCPSNSMPNWLYQTYK
ncbi:uncharacterized protein LOC128221043 isoform X2 [Mya arenaria]|uniref:uncharacterized protein LOC128221043 isoform X2 n=1 Tax=Mya arenaria TaxID=6604 RepID=UPI0022DFC075|nr:uncharacterized protein LOC128221043 isoform X2 [Mya arenaria]